jgi:hypothetical protein
MSTSSWTGSEVSVAELRTMWCAVATSADEQDLIQDLSVEGRCVDTRVGRLTAGVSARGCMGERVMGEGRRCAESCH